MKTAVLRIAMALLLSIAGFATSSAATAPSLSVATKPPASSVALVLEGAIGRFCKKSPDNGRVDMNACTAFTIPPEAVMGTPVEVSGPTSDTVAWISDGHLCYAGYGWGRSHCLPLSAPLPPGFSLTRRSLPDGDIRLQFVGTQNNPFTSDEQLKAMLKFREDLRVTKIKAFADIKTSSSTGAPMANDCNNTTNQGLKYGGGGQKLWDDCNNLSLEYFEGLADSMVSGDFADGMMDFTEKAKRDGLRMCSDLKSICSNTCLIIGGFEETGCGALGTIAGGLTAGIGIAVGVYCTGKVAIAAAQCMQSCYTPMVPCIQ